MCIYADPCIHIYIPERAIERSLKLEDSPLLTYFTASAAVSSSIARMLKRAAPAKLSTAARKVELTSMCESNVPRSRSCKPFSWSDLLIEFTSIRTSCNIYIHIFCCTICYICITKRLFDSLVRSIPGPSQKRKSHRAPQSSYSF